MVFCAAISGAGLGFCGSTPTRLKSSWVTSVPCHLGVRWVRWPWWSSKKLRSSSWGVFVAEAVSVIMQVASFKMTGKRIFRMAPLHHHFELKGWAEPKVIVRFWIITVILVLVGLSSLKIR